MRVKKTYLFSKIPVVMCKMPHLHSVVIGIWIKHGSRDEPFEKNGISHFIEHLFFQGTKNRNAKAISFAIDSLGGDINAFTSREFTVLYVKILDKCLEKGIELLCDIFSNPIFPQEEIEKERSVILDELRTINDTPDELIHDLFMEKAFPDGLGKPILGKENTISAITREDIINFHEKYYHSSNCIISCAGNFNEDMLLNMLERNLCLRDFPVRKQVIPPVFLPSINVYEKDLNEVHLSVGMETFPFTNPLRYALTILNCIIGGSVSSRLFQEIREKRGLVYNIFSYVSFYLDTGVFDIYTACSRNNLNKILELIMKIIKEIPENIKEEEIERAKIQTISQLLFSSESPASVMHNLAYNELYYNKPYEVKEHIKKFKSIKTTEIIEVASILKEKLPAITVLGPITRRDIDF